MDSSRSPRPDPAPEVQEAQSEQVRHPNKAPNIGDRLGAFDVFAFITNKMVGTGIFTAPSSVLVLTGNKWVAMAVWLIAFGYTIASMFIYLDYSTVLPYTGGELVYLDEITSQSSSPLGNDGIQQGRHENESSISESYRIFRSKIKSNRHKILGDGLLAYVLYSFLFVGLFNSGTNALQVGRQMLAAMDPGNTIPNGHMLRYIGVTALTALCFIQYFSTMAGRRLNRWFTIFKIMMLFALFVAGIVVAANNDYEGAGFRHCSPHRSKVGWAKALILAIFSFQGWENATFVAGEIDVENPTALRTGFISAVCVVGGFYIAINALFLYAIPYMPIEVSYAPMFFLNTDGAVQAWAAITTISALGSLNSIIYTFSRIKQCIGSGNVLPWSRLWTSDSPENSGDPKFQNKAPRGGLILHWIMSIIFISASISIHSLMESISVPGLLQTYAHCLILTCVALGIFRLPQREKEIGVQVQQPSDDSDGDRVLRPKPVWRWRVSHAKDEKRDLLWGFILLYAGVNILVMIVAAIPPYNTSDGSLGVSGWSLSHDHRTVACSAPGLTVNVRFPFAVNAGTGSAFPGWALPCVTFGVLTVGFAYYLSLFGSAKGSTLSFRHSLLDLADVDCDIRKEPQYLWVKEDVKRFGRRRMINYTPRGSADYLYWLFGGQFNQNSPWERFQGHKNDLYNWVSSTFLKLITGQISLNRR